MPPIDPFAPDTPALQRRDWIAGLEHGLIILEAFGDAEPRVTAAQMGAAPLVPLTSCMAAPLALPTHTPTV